MHLCCICLWGNLFDIYVDLPEGPQFTLVWLWNYAQIHSWNQPVLSKESKIILLNETTGAFDGIQAHNWRATTDYMSHTKTTVSCRLLEFIWFGEKRIHHISMPNIKRSKPELQKMVVLWYHFPPRWLPLLPLSLLFYPNFVQNDHWDS